VFILARVSLFVLLLLCAIGTWGMNIHTTASCQAYISTTQIAEGIAMTSVSLHSPVWGVDCPLTTSLQASLLLTLRVFALWQNGVLAGFLTLGLVGQLSICMLSITIMKWGDPQCWSVKATSQAPYYGGSSCFVTRPEFGLKAFSRREVHLRSWSRHAGLSFGSTQVI
jgi:hypothetical protein